MAARCSAPAGISDDTVSDRSVTAGRTGTPPRRGRCGGRGRPAGCSGGRSRPRRGAGRRARGRRGRSSRGPAEAAWVAAILATPRAPRPVRARVGHDHVGPAPRPSGRRRPARCGRRGRPGSPGRRRPPRPDCSTTVTEPAARQRSREQADAAVQVDQVAVRRAARRRSPRSTAVDERLGAVGPGLEERAGGDAPAPARPPPRGTRPAGRRPARRRTRRGRPPARGCRRRRRSPRRGARRCGRRPGAPPRRRGSGRR